jgi:hypothetical protein
MIKILPFLFFALSLGLYGAAGDFLFIKEKASGPSTQVRVTPNSNDLLGWQNGTLVSVPRASVGETTVITMTVPSIFELTGSPLTATGTLAITLANQTANRIWASPASGPAAPPGFRALVVADLPDLSSTYQAAASALTALSSLSPAGNSGKFVRANLAETGFELVTVTGGGDALKADPLSQFAVTTSAQLLGVLTDESGTGNILTTNGSAANLTSFPVLNQSTTGNAATATALQTARAINGVSFDGTAPITVPAAAGTLTGTTLAVSITASSLTSAAGGAFGSAAFTDASAYQPAAAALTTLSSATAAGLALMDDADAATQRTTLGLGTLATQNGTFSGTSSGTNTGDQDLSGYLTAVAAAGAYQPLAAVLTNTTAAFTTAQESKLAGIASGATAFDGAYSSLSGRPTLGTLASQNGTITDYLTTATATSTYQPLSGTLTTLSGATAAGLALMDDADAAAQRTTLGLGTLATQSGTFSGTSSGTNTGDQDLSGYLPISTAALTYLTPTGSAANLTSFPVLNQSTTGNAATATALQTARAINGVSFDGTAPITVPSAAGTLTGTTLAAGVTASSLTSAAGGTFGTAAFTDATAYQSSSAVLTTLSGATAAGLALMDDADAATQRATLGLGTLATQSGTFSGTSSGTNTGDQDLSGYLTAGSAATTYEPIIGAGTLALSKLATDPLARTNHTGTQAWSTLTSTPTTLAGYGISDAITAATAASTYQPLDADLTTFASISPSANIQSFLGSANYTAARVALLPSLAGNAGKFLKINGGETDVEFATIAGGGDALTSNPLSQFASTTSSQLRGVLSDENGTGEFLTTNGSAASLTNFPAATTSVAGVVELATSGETGAGVVVQGNDSRLAAAITDTFVIACSNLTDAITAGTAKAFFRPRVAMTVVSVRAYVLTAPTGSLIEVDINEAGVSILSTRLTIDSGEVDSTTAATPAAIADYALAAGASVTIDFDQVGATTGGVGLVVEIVVTYP